MNRFLEWLRDVSLLRLLWGLLCIFGVILLIVFHFGLYLWICSEVMAFGDILRTLRRIAVAAVLLIVFYAAIGIAGLMACRKIR